MAPAAEIVADHFFGEVVVACWHGCVGGGHRVRSDGFQRGGIGQACLNQAADTFEDQEGGMALVDVLLPEPSA